jgi:2-polyprenyl-3-methyl-5-hydroxy-6-metoxy-1,4-benzoquinol methylase
MSLLDHPIVAALARLGLAEPASFAAISTRVRDRDDVHALRCARSGVVVLNRVDHVTAGAYEDRGDLSYWGSADRAALLASTFADDSRRAALLKPMLAGKALLDVGTGLGGLLDLLRDAEAALAAVEPQRGARDMLAAAGYTVYRGLDEAPPRGYDAVSAFHVLEHVPDQIGFLEQMRSRLKPGGLLVVEVPHANDALLTLYQSQAFLDFTLWSQHLVLHTRASLEGFIGAAGFRDVRVEGVQRYPLANHLHWLAAGKPGGHERWPFLKDGILDAAYAGLLASLDKTDTLMATATA